MDVFIGGVLYFGYYILGVFVQGNAKNRTFILLARLCHVLLFQILVLRFHLHFYSKRLWWLRRITAVFLQVHREEKGRPGVQLTNKVDISIEVLGYLLRNGKTQANVLLILAQHHLILVE